MASTTSRKTIDEFLALKRIAVIGVSRNENAFSRNLYRAMRKRGYDLVPVNPNVEEIEGDRCYPRLQDVAPAVDGVLLMTKPGLTERAVMDCDAAGVKHVWMYRATGQGAVSKNAVSFCKSRKIDVVAGECPFMFLKDTEWFHRAHRFVKQITGTLPA
jgi:uncharacterized protein